MQEGDGPNVYAFVRNAPTNTFYTLGDQAFWVPNGPSDRPSDGWMIPVPPLPPGAYIPEWARAAGEFTINFSTLFGQGGSAAVYIPFPAAPAFGVYLKFDGTMKTGTCCKDDVKKSYSTLTGTITVGVYTGNPGTEFRVTLPFVENLSQCPEPSVLKINGVAQGSVRLGPASFTLSINSDGKVSFSGSYQVPVNLFSARAAVGGGFQGSWAQINN